MKPVSTFKDENHLAFDDADEQENELAEISFDDAIDALPFAVELGYRICVLLDMHIEIDFDWHELSGEFVFENALIDDSLGRYVQQGLSSGLTRDELVRGIEGAMRTWAEAQDIAGDLSSGLCGDSGANISDLTVDCYISECADEDEGLHEIRMLEPLLYSAICIELSRAVRNMSR
jgi:hypothetical protein